MFARSGVGKSSFLVTKLIPELRKDSAIQYINEWGQATPDQSLADNFRLAEDQNNALSESMNPDKPIIVLDQFEDVFKARYDRIELWESMAEITNVADPPAHLLVSMREEWLGAWEEASQYIPADVTSLVRLAPLRPVDLRRSVQHAVTTEGTVSIEDDLIQNILQDLSRPNAFGLGDSYVEPGLLQLVCSRLWEEARAANNEMTVELYQRLGRADRIIREFVWREIGRVEDGVTRFNSPNRLMWVGLTRHLSVSQGVKAIVSVESLAKTLRVEDLGVAGSAMIASKEPTATEHYLQQPPEDRPSPPSGLLEWIAETLNAGVAAGFLKRQKGLAKDSPAGTAQQYQDLFELSHDALSEKFQTFAIEFESMIRSAWARFLGAAFGVLVVLPVFLFALMSGSFFEIIQAFAISMFFAALYIGVTYIAVQIIKVIVNAIKFPIIRRIAKREVPTPRTSATEQAPGRINNSEDG
jgi:hypothetical protein